MLDQVCVDTVAFAHDAGEMRGSLAVLDLPRLHDVVFDKSGNIAYRLAGAVDKDGIASLRLELTGELLLTCQRCLGPVSFSLKSARSFILVAQTEVLGDPADEPDDVEHIPADANLNVASLVEDETILCMPMVPGHKPGECSPPVDTSGETDVGKSPFSALAQLKRQ